MNRRGITLLILLSAALIAPIGCGAPSATVAISSPAAPREPIGPLLCLRTEWYPQRPEGDGGVEHATLREIFRQGVLIAARDELGLVTRDQTLGEPFPTTTDTPDAPEAGEPNTNSKAPPALDLTVRIDQSGNWEARLTGAGWTAAKPVWSRSGSLDPDPQTLYAQAAEQVSEAVAEISEALREAGASASPPPAAVAIVSLDEAEAWLEKMDFVSQFAAVRTAHRALGAEGASPEWLGVLARGYAHLAMLTEHTWSSQPDAFAARSLLYAERAMLKSGEADKASWLRAYAQAVVGLHGAALDEAERLLASETPAPPWAGLVVPFCRFDHDSLERVIESHPELTETAALLQWQLYRSYFHGRWIYEKGLEAAQTCPEAYGVYSVMANWSALKIKRVGAWTGAEAFASSLPARVAKLDGLPDSVKTLVAEQPGWIAEMLSGLPAGDSSGRPMNVSRALRSAAAESLAEECSWAILAELIAEEQFVEAADALRVSTDATEHSNAGLVARLRPLVEGHRYAPFIESYAAPRTNPAAAKAEIAKLTVVDPRATMRGMLSKGWQAKLSGERWGSQLGCFLMEQRPFRQPTLIDLFNRVAMKWTNTVTHEQRTALENELAAVSPESPNATRARWNNRENLTSEQIAEWESQLTADPIGWMQAAAAHYRIEDYQNAARCYRRSLDISPCHDATTWLANCYWELGKTELWEPTLMEYLEVEDLGLAHAGIHRKIAEEHIRNRRWTKAEPHAVEAADTYSGWGLKLAAQVYEGMQDPEKAGHYYAEGARSYPSSMGTHWYFWTVRTGQGDAEAARAAAEQSLAVAEHSSYYDPQLRMALCHWFDGDHEAALRVIDQRLQPHRDSKDPWARQYNSLLTAIIAGECGDAERQKSAIESIRQTAQHDDIKQWPDWIVVYEALAEALEGKELSDATLQTYGKALRETSDRYRCDYNCFLGAALEQQGKPDLADEYLGIAAFFPPFDLYTSTLAGRSLVRRHGADRGGTPQVYAQQEEAARAEAESADASEETASATEPE
ncbi:hypothetical protein Mal64_39230 [Pseudobythopirellula maris]|uniref:Uncharacterized protein n=1 Tax=Pseudobythopirellula maris TaxID=2527991 RepID=A0A5C5ZI09_9BACT|nr:hypothetical protein [Pseudobythopirellula maris]TWT86183.1 hypothetical protein Mal64_39230 [Pseudobythopirellula maris]